MKKEDVFNEFPKYSDDEGNERKKQAYSLMFDIVTNPDVRLRFLNSCIGSEYKDELVNDFGGCSDNYITEEAYDSIEQIIDNHIMDDAEFWLVYDKRLDKWMFSLSYDWIAYKGNIKFDLKEMGVDYHDCMYDYLDIWKGLDVFIKFCEAIISNDYSWMKENELSKMISLKEGFDNE